VGYSTSGARLYAVAWAVRRHNAGEFALPRHIVRYAGCHEIHLAEALRRIGSLKKSDLNFQRRNYADQTKSRI